MTIGIHTAHRGGQPVSTHSAQCLQDKFEVLKDIGDGSFGSVTLARVRGAGAHIAKRGTLVCHDGFKRATRADLFLGRH